MNLGGRGEMTEDWKVEMVELLPCPFCGGKATMGNSGSTVWFIECYGADCKIKPDTPVFRSPSLAIEAWNGRV